MINFSNKLSLQETAEAIADFGHKVPMFVCGEPGIGKSAMGREVARLRGHEIFSVIDCATLELGDTGTPYQNKDEGCTEFLPNARFGIHRGKDLTMMLDEFTKSMRPVMNMLMPVFNDKRLYDKYLTPESVVFATGNLTTDGVNDAMPPHFVSRTDIIYTRKPTAEEWVQWGAENGISPSVLAWALAYPHAFQSYTDFEAGTFDPKAPPNPYIFFPQLPKNSFVCPRSLERASYIVDARERRGDSVTFSCLAGAIGKSAAGDMQAYITVIDELEDWDKIIAMPDKVRIPENPIAVNVQIQQAMMKSTKETLSPIVKYIKRLPRESQAVFGTSLYKLKDKRDVAIRNREFAEWAVQNHWMLPDVK